MMIFVGMLLLIYKDAFIYGLAVKGQFGIRRADTTFAVKEKVTWRDAADLCYIQHHGKWNLFAHSDPDLFKIYLMYFRNNLLRSGWPLSDHIWTSVIGDGISPWQKSRFLGSCKPLPDTYNGYLPYQSVGNTKCLLLNMTGNNEDDVWIFKPCDEQYSFFCRPGDIFDPAEVELTIYNDTTINLGILLPTTTIKIIIRKSLDACQRKFRFSILTFAVMYFNGNESCVILTGQVDAFPVTLELQSEINSTTVIQTKGPKVATVDKQSIRHTESLYEDCFPADNISDVEAQNSSLPNTESVIVTTGKSSPETTVPEVTLIDAFKNDSVNSCREYCESRCMMGNQSIWRPVYGSRFDSVRIDKKLLSSYNRRLRSAADKRLSSLFIGLSGAAVLVLVTLTIIVSDMMNAMKTTHNRNKQLKV